MSCASLVASLFTRRPLGQLDNMWCVCAGTASGWICWGVSWAQAPYRGGSPVQGHAHWHDRHALKPTPTQWNPGIVALPGTLSPLVMSRTEKLFIKWTYNGGYCCRWRSKWRAGTEEGQRGYCCGRCHASGQGCRRYYPHRGKDRSLPIWSCVCFVILSQAWLNTRWYLFKQRDHQIMIHSTLYVCIGVWSGKGSKRTPSISHLQAQLS